MSTELDRGHRYSLPDLGITSSTDHELEISVDAHALGLEDLRLVLDPETKRWKLTPATIRDVTNGHVNGQLKPKSISNPVKSWVDNLPNTDHIKFFKSVDWASTPLGPLEQWPVSLQTLVNFCMGDSGAAAIYWGPELCSIFNAEMTNVNRTRFSRDDGCLGQPFQTIWPEVWSEYGTLLTDVLERGVPLDTLDVTLFPLRNGIAEETFWRGGFFPIRDPNGQIQGLFNKGRETSKEVITERRTKTLNAIALPPTSESNVWQHLFDAFRENDREFPMAFIYKATDEADSGIRLQLEEGIGLPSNGHPLVPKEFDLFEGHTGFAPYFRRAKAADRPLVLHRSNGTLPAALVDGFEWQGFGESSTSMAIIAINASDRLLAVMVVGLNPRRPYDLDYEGFLNSLARHMSAAITNAVDKEEAKMRAVRLGRQLEESEKQIREIAVHGPVGMIQVALNGKIHWANDQYYELTGHSRADEDQYELSFLEVVDPRDRELCVSKWTAVVVDLDRISIALRLKRTWKPPAGADGVDNPEEPIWVTISAFPVLDHDGGVKFVAGAVTDVSRFKWAEAVESRNAAAAKEAKRLQENFIDIVSHEMRNPLSAITQLADGISNSLEDLNGSTDIQKAEELLKDNVESAKTILLCAAHQKRIIDDVLTLSKLDSMMLSITPVIVQPRKIVESALRMFEGEFQTNRIDFRSWLDTSYDTLGVDWATLDPSRLTQIFINLITNAIKFTKLEEKREIRVRASVTLTRPPTIAGVTWFPTHKEYRDLTQSKEWGTGQELFFCFEVQDTGRGLEQEEMSKLFGRFQQATAKTHIKYGGSGLGLFISRELTETQGGEIGVMSEPGKGSTFAFYIKGRRAEAPDEPAQLLAPVTSTVEAERHQLEEMPANQNPAQAIDAVDHSRPVLLLVEDNVVNAKVLSHQLERANCDVHIANHGMEALDFLRKTRCWHEIDEEAQALDVDCILMDVEMPIMDGLTCTRRIRQLEMEGLLMKHINIVAITANARQEQIEIVTAAGADDVMPKPFRVKEILAKVQEVRTRNSSRQTLSQQNG